METTRFLLIISLGLVLTMIWQAWVKDYGHLDTQYKTKTTVEQKEENEIVIQETTTPTLNIEENISPRPTNDTEATPFEKIKVTTDVFDLAINPQGGTIEYAALKKYPVSKKNQDKKIVILKRKENDNYYLIQGGVLSKNGTITPDTIFSFDRNSYSLGDNESISVPLYYVSEEGVKTTKTITFYKGQYVADIEYKIENQSPKPWAGRAYGEISRTKQKERESRFIYTYTGAVVSTPEQRYEKIDFDDIEDGDLKIDAANGWAAMLQHYFLTAIIPSKKDESYTYFTRNANNKGYIVGAATPTKEIVAGSKGKLSHRIYVGPKEQKEIEKIAEGLSLTVDYGIFWFIAKPLYWLLDYINTFTDNWGWSIVLVTIFLKLLFYKLSAKGYRSMANMRRVQPRLVAIKERYKDDRTQLNSAMMDIYKREKINPLGGCFPILIQIPVFISLYWVLLESVELRQADFILWINDLSIADPFFVLPLLMGITMFIQQKLNPAPMDPIQAKVMSILPIVFTIFFAFFPAGLVLYWVANNMLSIVQQWAITRSIEKTSANKTTK
jgi:YidC/Oxa1 family membrane protein insertase